MADAEKEKAEKLAAAKKRFEQLKKEKAQAGKSKGKSKQPGVKSEKKDLDAKVEQDKTKTELEETDEETKIDEPGSSISRIDAKEDHEDDNVSDVSKSNQKEADSTDDINTKPEHSRTQTRHGRQPSLSVQSKMRSDSFRQGSLSTGPLSPGRSGQELPTLSPDGASVNEIYRKQTARLEELEKENKRLTKDSEALIARQRKLEEEIEELRDNSSQIAELRSRAEKAAAKDEEIAGLRTEIASLQRQNSHLQSYSQKGPRPSQSISPQSDLQAQLDSKSATIESMELEISNLQAQISKYTSNTDASSAQIAALEEKLRRAESAAGSAQRELQDVRKSLDRASEKAVKEGSERTSAETKIRALGQDNEEKSKQAEEALKRAETLEKKLAALTQLHKDADVRRQAGEREREKTGKESADLRKKVGGLEAENTRLREERERARRRDAGGTDDEGLDELEDEERRKLEARIRELEGELYEMRSGAWREKRIELQGQGGAVVSPGEKFDEVDLSNGTQRRPSMKQQSRGSFANVLTSGFSAFTGGGDSEGLLEDDDLGFDEDAFRAAQQEDATKRIERVKAIKRGLKNWEGWRLDLVELRTTAGGGLGEIFEV